MSLSQNLKEKGIDAPILIMQSSGGMMRAEVAVEKPINVIESGPAAGVVGAAYLGKRLNIDNLLTLDMGGTTAKVSMIEGGQFTRSDEYQVGGGISIGSRLITGGGYVLRVPSIDIAEVGAGGGSYLWLDSAKGFHVGPISAGAVPGPACYDSGGNRPTITDANVVIGYLNPYYLLAGELKLKPERARRAIENEIAKPLNMDPLEAAYGGFIIANSSMIRAIRAVSSQKGRDIRNFTLFAFGGAGPIHATTIAQELGIPKVLVPPNSGLFSSVGLLFADIEYHHMETFHYALNESIVDKINGVLAKMADMALSMAKRGQHTEVEVTIDKYLSMRYIGQATELTILSPWTKIDPEKISLLKEAFHQEHQKTYLNSAVEEPIEIVKLRVVARVISDHKKVAGDMKLGKRFESSYKVKEVRKAYFGKQYGLLDTEILRQNDVSSIPKEGPLIVELYDTTIVVPPKCNISRGDQDIFVINIAAATKKE